MSGCIYMILFTIVTSYVLADEIVSTDTDEIKSKMVPSTTDPEVQHLEETQQLVESSEHFTNEVVHDEPGIFMPNSFLTGVSAKSKYRPKCTFMDMDCSTKKVDCFVLLCYGKKKRKIQEHDEIRQKRSMYKPHGKA